MKYFVFLETTGVIMHVGPTHKRLVVLNDKEEVNNLIRETKLAYDIQNIIVIQGEEVSVKMKEIEHVQRTYTKEIEGI